MQKTTLIASITGIIFIIGTGIIIYFGRPAMKRDENQESAQVNTPIVNQEDESSENDSEKTVKTGENAPATTTTTTPATPSVTTSGTYTTAQVETHANASDCWSIVSNNVYDLTSWISRHPGGDQAIISMCGNNATSNFTRQHGGSSAAKAALILLKMGTLVQ